MRDNVLQLRHLEKSFGGRQISDDVSLDLRRGEVHALVGPKGAGKSTLIDQIAGTLRPDAGTVTFQGKDISRVHPVRRARAGLVRSFQVPVMAMELTVLQNVVLGAVGQRGWAFRLLRRAMRDHTLLARARAALDRLALTDLEDVLAGDLSHEQRRQLEIAIALTLAPQAFLLDEPFAGMGAAGARQLSAFFQELKHEAPILLAERSLENVAACADRISVLDQGAIIASGSLDEMRANPHVQLIFQGEGAVR